VNAKDRIGNGPWYDRLGRIVAQDLTALLNERPEGADPAILNDLPNEYGVPNHDPEGTGEVDNHDFLTGTDAEGNVYGGAESTCDDWTSSSNEGSPRCGHTWPTGGGDFPVFDGGIGFDGGFGNMSLANWMSALDEAGCAPGINLVETGGPGSDGTRTVGSGGGYGGIYCFALTP
jgi:hypothetical protein